MEHVIRQYKLEAGAQEVAYMEEMFTEFSGTQNPPTKSSAACRIASI